MDIITLLTLNTIALVVGVLTTTFFFALWLRAEYKLRKHDESIVWTRRK